MRGSTHTASSLVTVISLPMCGAVVSTQRPGKHEGTADPTPQKMPGASSLQALQETFAAFLSSRFDCCQFTQKILHVDRPCPQIARWTRALLFIFFDRLFAHSVLLVHLLVDERHAPSQHLHVLVDTD
jgi:hypothetical protein